MEFDDPKRRSLQWSQWLESAGLEKAKPKGILRFNQYDLVIHAALAGQGVALGRHNLIEPLLAEGRLIPLATSQKHSGNDNAYWLVLADQQPREEVKIVADWIQHIASSVSEELA